jgi:hypothetical protein
MRTPPPPAPATKPPPPAAPRAPRNPPPAPPTPQAAVAPAAAAIKPVPPPPNGRAAAAVAPAQEEEEIPWEKLGRDTVNHQARIDTPPRSGSRPAVKRPPKPTAAPAAAKRLPWWVFAVMAGMVVVGVVVLLGAAFVLGLFGRRAVTATTDSAGSAMLYVGKDAPYKHVADALNRVKPGQHIIVQDDTVEEQLLVDEKEGKEHFTGVTIEPEGDKQLLWRFPKNASQEEKLVRLNGTAGFRLRKITFDGDNRVLTLAIVFGRCPGLTLEGVQFQGFKRCALLVNNCEGEEKRPVLLERVRFVSTNPATEAAVLFDLSSTMLIPFNKNLTFSDCRFEGPYQDGTPIKNKAAALQAVKLEGKNMAVIAAGQPETPVQLPK